MLVAVAITGIAYTVLALVAGTLCDGLTLTIFAVGLNFCLVVTKGKGRGSENQGCD